jgi:hypothetical protein
MSQSTISDSMMKPLLFTLSPLAFAKIMDKTQLDQVYLLTGVNVAIDQEDGILIAGMFSDSPFTETKSEQTPNGNLVASFALTKQKAKFLRDRLDEFLQG